MQRRRYGVERKDRFFDCHEGELQSIAILIPAIERAFDLGERSRLRSPWLLTKFEDIDTLVTLVEGAITYDKKTEQA